jgi:hypothetical protein
MRSYAKKMLTMLKRLCYIAFIDNATENDMNAATITFNGQTDNEIISRNWKRNSLLRVALYKNTVYHWATLHAASKKGSAIRAYALHMQSRAHKENDMTAKHTPGPWTVLSHSWSDTSIIAPGFDHGVCRLDINHATEESQQADEAQMEANARLIAAAPDHHAVALELDRLMLVIESAVRWQDPNNHAAVVALVKANRAAITKATGSND